MGKDYQLPITNYQLVNPRHFCFGKAAVKISGSGSKGSL
jgi:hypothetical protein